MAKRFHGHPAQIPCLVHSTLGCWFFQVFGRQPAGLRRSDLFSLGHFGTVGVSRHRFLTGPAARPWWQLVFLQFVDALEMSQLQSFNFGDFMQVHDWIHCWIPVARFLNGLATCWVNMLVHFWWWKSKSKGLNPGNLELWKSVDTQLWNQQNARTQQTIVGTPFETDDHSTKYLWVFYISSAWLEWPRTKKVPTTFWATFLAPPFLTVWHLRFTESPPHRIGLDYNTILQSISPDALLGWYRLPPAMRA